MNHGNMVFPDDPRPLAVVTLRLKGYYGDKYTERMAEDILGFLGRSVPAEETPEYLLEHMKGILPEYLSNKTAEEASGFLQTVLSLARTVRRMALRGWTQEEVEKGVFPKKFRN